MFHHNENILMVLKYVEQSNDVWMLANLKNLNLSFVKLKVFWIHLFLLENFDRYFFTSLFVNSQLYSSEFSFPYGFLNFVVRKYVLVSNCLFEFSNPKSIISLI